MTMGEAWRYEEVYLAQEDLRLQYALYAAWRADEKRMVYDISVMAIQQGNRECAVISDIAVSQQMALRILLLFAEHTVTPIAAQDILEELLSDAAFLYADGI